MKNLNWRQSAVVLASLLFFAAGVVFVIRAVRPIIYWHYHQDEPIRPWMNIGYIAHSYRVPPHVLYQALGLPHKPPDKRPIRDIARAQNRSVAEVIGTLQNAIVHARPPYPPPPPPAPDPGRSP
jgi:hypothetical protein